MIQYICRIWVIFLALFMVAGCGNPGNKNENAEREKGTMEPGVVKEQPARKKVILFFGNSLTAGYGLETGEAFPSLIQDRLDSLDLAYEVINAGLSGETTAGGAGRIDWILEQPVDIFVLELGGNDMLRGLDVGETEKNLHGILETVKGKYPDIPIIIAGMKAPPNMGQEYTRQFEGIYPRLAKEFTAGLIPFFLEGVGGIDSLNLADGIHPNAKGQKIVRENVWSVLENYLRDHG